MLQVTSLTQGPMDKAERVSKRLKASVVARGGRIIFTVTVRLYRFIALV